VSVKIRLQRMGTKKKPFYRMVVADNRFPRDGRCIENLGVYDPKRAESPLTLQADRAAVWVGRGVQLTETVRSLLKGAKVPGVV